MLSFVYVYTIKIKKAMLQIKLEPQEIQLAIVAIHQAQFQGKNAHMVSSTLKKFEDKIANFQPA